MVDQLGGAHLSIDETQSAKDAHTGCFCLFNRLCCRTALGADVIKDDHRPALCLVQALDIPLHPMLFRFFAHDECIDLLLRLDAFPCDRERNRIGSQGEPSDSFGKPPPTVELPEECPPDQWHSFWRTGRQLAIDVDVAGFARSERKSTKAHRIAPQDV